MHITQSLTHLVVVRTEARTHCVQAEGDMHSAIMQQYKEVDGPQWEAGKGSGIEARHFGR